MPGQRARGARARHQHPRMALRMVHVELAVLVALLHDVARLWVDEGQVITLVEIVLNDLPVEIALQRHPVGPAHLLHLVAGDLRHDRTQMFGQRRRLGIEVDPDEPGKNLAAHLAQLHPAARRATGEILGAGDKLQVPFRGKAPAVIGAGDRLGMALLGLDQPVPAVRADVVEGADLAILAARHQDRFPADLVSEVIAGIRDLLDQPADQPGLGPDVVPFALHELLRPIAFAADRPGAERR